MKENCFYHWKELQRIIVGSTPYEEDVRKLTALERAFARANEAWETAWTVASQATADHDKRYALASALLWLEHETAPLLPLPRKRTPQGHRRASLDGSNPTGSPEARLVRVGDCKGRPWDPL